MKQLYVRFGRQCNNACVFCFFDKTKKHSKKFKFYELAKKIETFSKNNGEKNLIISGGEPLISDRIFDLLELSRQKGIKFLGIQTNGRMLAYEKIISNLKKFEPIAFLVSFHFPSDKLYKKYCKSNGFYQVIEGIKNLLKYDCNFMVSTVVMRQNLPYLRKIIKLLKSIGVKKYQYKLANGRHIINEYEKFIPRYSDCLPIIKKIISDNPDMEIKLRQFPICVVEKKMRHMILPISGKDELILTSWGKEMLTNRPNKMPSFFPNCKKCIHLPNCQGIEKEYAQIYGTKEFKPEVKHKNEL